MMLTVNRRAASTALVLTGILLLSMNLRPAAVSVGPVLRDIQNSLHMSGAATGLLTSLPVLAFAVFGAMAPWAAQRIGLHRVTLFALLAVAVGLLSRSFAGTGATLLGLSAIAMAGMALANVLLPSLVKQHFPDRIGTVTALYTMMLNTGLALSLMLTVPISEAGNGWRTGLAAWAVLAVLAVIPWLVLARRDDGHASRRRGLRFADVARTRLALAMALFFGLQSIQAYVIFNWFSTLWRDAGYTATQAGLLVGLITVVSVPLSLLLPSMVHRLREPRPLMLGVLAFYPVAYGLMLVDAHTFALPAAIMLGVATTIFPVVLVLIGMRARSPEGTATLSSVTQALGYLIAGLGPFGFGWLHDLTGGWTVPLWVIMALIIPKVALTFYLGRPLFIEDQLTPAGPASSGPTRTRS